MSIGPLSRWPATRQGESRRTRLAILIGAAGIAAILLAYALSPGVRHAVGHAERSVKHAVSRVFDRDQRAHRATRHPAGPASRAHTLTRARPAPASRPTR
jgi:hypothetical protein